MFRTILVPVDGSELAERALPYATALARPADGHVILLRAEPLVWQERPPRDGTSATRADPSGHAWLSPADPGARMTLEAAAARVQADGVTAEVDFQRYLRGEARTANVILTAVQERRPTWWSCRRTAARDLHGGTTAAWPTASSGARTFP